MRPVMKDDNYRDEDVAGVPSSLEQQQWQLDQQRQQLKERQALKQQQLQLAQPQETTKQYAAIESGFLRRTQR